MPTFKAFCRDLVFKGPNLKCSFLAWGCVVSGGFSLVCFANLLNALVS